MTGKVLHAVSEQRLVAVSPGHERTRVVRNDELEHAAVERQRPGRRAQPVARNLRRCGMGKAVTRYPHSCHGDVGAAHP